MLLPMIAKIGDRLCLLLVAGALLLWPAGDVGLRGPGLFSSPALPTMAQTASEAPTYAVPDCRRIVPSPCPMPETDCLAKCTTPFAVVPPLFATEISIASVTGENHGTLPASITRQPFPYPS